MRMPALAGLAAPQKGGQSFARPNTAPAVGNPVNPNTGPGFDMQAGPGVQSQSPWGPGPNATGGNLGGNDGTWGSMPGAPGIQPAPHVSVLGEGQESFRRWAIQGFNDRLTAKDRHVYWDTGNQLTGLESKPGGVPNAYNNPLVEPPRPELRAVNRTVSYQKGTDTTRNQDDLSRAYTWLGEQGSGWAPVYGGVPGFYQPYGSRGGLPFPFVSHAVEGGPGDGPQRVWAGPPHGLHSYTTNDRLLTMSRFAVNPQMRPVRIDRPSNSPQAGQSFSQTVVPQGGQPTGPQQGAQAWIARVGGRGWLGTGQ